MLQNKLYYRRNNSNHVDYAPICEIEILNEFWISNENEQQVSTADKLAFVQ